MRATLASLALLLVSPAWAANESLADDYARMMGWLSSEMVEPLAFNAGTTFDPPVELKPYNSTLDLSIGLGMLPLDTGKFPALANKTLNDRNVGASFPKRIPFPDLSAHIRVALPRRFEAAARVSNVTAPTINLTPDTKAGGQANNVGFQVRKYFMGTMGRPKLAVGVHGNYLWGGFEFESKFNDVDMAGVISDADNKGSMRWSLASVGVNAVLSQTYGPWTPFAGLGFNVARGQLETSLHTHFETVFANDVDGVERGRPRANNLRLLFGTQLDRRRGRDLFLSGEILLAGSQGHAFNVHLGMIIPLRVGFGQEKIDKGARVIDDYRDAPRSIKQEKFEGQHLIFIH